jgi:hypothetical protein
MKKPRFLFRVGENRQEEEAWLSFYQV